MSNPVSTSSLASATVSGRLRLPFVTPFMLSLEPLRLAGRATATSSAATAPLCLGACWKLRHKTGSMAVIVVLKSY